MRGQVGKAGVFPHVETMSVGYSNGEWSPHGDLGKFYREVVMIALGNHGQPTQEKIPGNRSKLFIDGWFIAEKADQFVVDLVDLSLELPWSKNHDLSDNMAA